MQKIAKSMREAGLIKAVKGKNGGYNLNKPIGKISLKEVMEAVDGEYGIVDCTKKGSCKKNDLCNIKQGVGRINKEITKYLEKTTINSMIS